MDTPPPAAQKKGLGPLAWIGIGCGGIIVLGIIALILVSVWGAGQAKQIAENPTKWTATLMTKVPGFEMVEQDDAGKRYTVKETKTGKLTTIYWNEKTQKPETVVGDFSAIPAGVSEPAPAPPSEEKEK